MNNIKMLYFDTNDVSEGIDFNKTSASKECDICHYQHFLNKWLKFQPYACNRCHDVLLNIKVSDYHCIITGISKSEVKKLLQDFCSTEKSGT